MLGNARLRRTRPGRVRLKVPSSVVTTYYVRYICSTSTTLEVCPNGPVEGPVVRLDARSYCIEIPTIEAPLHLTPSSEGVSSDA
jgi:hypothetical protein